MQRILERGGTYILENGASELVWFSAVTKCGNVLIKLSARAGNILMKNKSRESVIQTNVVAYASISVQRN